MKHTNWKALFCLLLVACAYTWRLDAPLLWGDEAGTAIFGRSVIRNRVPLGFDGRNLAVFGNCSAVSKSLLSKKIPWVQYYTAALSLSLFGESTKGARLLFALIGVAAFFPLCAVLRRQSRYPELITTMVLLSPQVVLFHRNARYYAVVTLLFAFLLWTCSHKFKSRKRQTFFASLCAVLFFHTHQLAAFCSMSAMVVFCLLSHRKSLKIYLTASITGFIFWFLFFLSMEGVRGKSGTIVGLAFENPSKWFSLFFSGLKAGLLDLDFVNCLPLLAWGMLLLLALRTKEKRDAAFDAFRIPVCQIILINIAFQVVANAAVLGFESQYHYSLLRYMPHLVATGMMPLFLMIEKVMTAEPRTSPKKKKRKPDPNIEADSSKRRVFGQAVPAAFLLLAASNAFSFSYWFEPLPGRDGRFSWWGPVYAEIVSPAPDGMESLMDAMKGRGESGEDTIYADPAYMNEVVNFYLGNEYLILPDVIRGSECEQVILENIGGQALRRFLKQPRWLVAFFYDLKTSDGYGLTRIPFFRHSPDASRPELTRHGFVSDQRIGYINLYERK